VRNFQRLATLALCAAGLALTGATTFDPGAFRTNAKFSVDSAAMSLSSVVATIEPRLGAPGYSWLRINFYSFPLTAEDVAAVATGNIEPLEKRWKGVASDPKAYNVSHAMLQLSVDAAFKVWQVDMSMPGHGCTVAPFEEDVRSFLQGYKFDGKRLALKSKGSHVCDMKALGIPNQTFRWDVDVNIPVFAKAK